MHKKLPRCERLMQVMEFCQTPRTVAEIAAFQGTSKTNVNHLTAELQALGYMRINRKWKKGRTCWFASYQTIVMGELPEPEKKVKAEVKPLEITTPVLAKWMGYGI